MNDRLSAESQEALANVRRALQEGDADRKLEPGTAPLTITLREGEDRELQAISHIISILEHFDAAQRDRMLDYLCERFAQEIDLRSG